MSQSKNLEIQESCIQILPLSLLSVWLKLAEPLLYHFQNVIGNITHIELLWALNKVKHVKYVDMLYYQGGCYNHHCHSYLSSYRNKVCSQGIGTKFLTTLLPLEDLAQNIYSENDCWINANWIFIVICFSQDVFLLQTMETMIKLTKAMGSL